MTAVDFLLWVRGSGFQIATAIFVFGMTYRLLEIFLLGRKPDYSVPRGNRLVGGIRTLFSRSIAEKHTFQRSTFTIVAGYIFHLGIFIILFLFVPHIILFQELLGFGWMGLPTLIIDAIAVITLLALLAVLIHRLKNPVLRFISTFQDYFAWTVTFIALLTGYMASHYSIQPYSLMLALHILSIEILMIVFPFTKLMHAFTFIIARWYSGTNAGHKGIPI